MTTAAELAAIRAVARQLRSTTRPLEVRRLSALAASLDHSVRALGRGIEFLRGELEGRPRAVELGDPEPYAGLDLAQAATVLAERVLALAEQSGVLDRYPQMRMAVAAEVDGFAAAASGLFPASSGRGVSAVHPAADGPGKARSGARDTSKAAALLAEPRSGTNRRAILEAVIAVARDPRTVGLTDVEIQRATGLNPNSARPRRVELVDGGWLVDSGQTREHFGREHTVWVLTEKAARLAAGSPAAV